MTHKKDIRTPVRNAKKNRRHMKISFTKSFNTFQNLVKANAQQSMLEGAYAALVRAYEALDKSHENHTGLVRRPGSRLKVIIWRSTSIYT